MTDSNAFTIDPNVFPIDLTSQALPRNWEEDKWEHHVLVYLTDGTLVRMRMKDLLVSGVSLGAKFAGYESVNKTHGRQVFFGLNPESVLGNMFSGLLYHERAGGGSTLVVAAQDPHGDWYVALLDQERPGQNQSRRGKIYKRIRQIIGGYPIDMGGKPSEIHLATTVSEGTSELAGKIQISPESLVNLYSPYNSNNGYVLTGKGQGIATQLLVIPFKSLTEGLDGTYSLDRDKAEVVDRKLERIFAERFHRLDKNLLRTLHESSDGYAACAKTIIAIDRAYFYLELGI